MGERIDYQVAIARALFLMLILSLLFPLSTTIMRVQIYPFDFPLSLLIILFVVSDISIRAYRDQVIIFAILTLFSIWVIFTSAFSLNTAESVRSGLVWVRAVGLFGILTVTYGVWYDINDIGRAALALVVIQGFLATFQAIFQTSFGQLNQYFGTKKLIQAYARIGGEKVLRSQGTLSNPNTLSHWIAVLGPLSLLSFDKSSSVWSPRFASIVLIGATTLLTTQTRGTAVITLVSAVIVVAIFVNGSHLAYYTTPIAIISPLVLILMGGWFGIPYLERFYAITDGASTRLAGVFEAIAVIPHYPFTGAGYHMYPAGAEAAEAVIAGSPERVHNILLLITAETGIVGGILYSGFFVFAFRKLLQSYQKEPTLVVTIYLYVYLNLIGIMALYTSGISFQFIPIYVMAISTGVAIYSDID